MYPSHIAYTFTCGIVAHWCVVSGKRHLLCTTSTHKNDDQRASICHVDLLKDEVKRLLHIPDHIFNLLAKHAKGHHTDRHFCTHAVYVRKGPGSHVLINSHPIYEDAAFAAGLVNEPSVDAPPNLEMRVMQV